MSTFTQELIKFCLQEWEFFGKAERNLNGTIKDGQKEYYDGPSKRIADYWKFIGGSYKNLTGRDRGTPWSAAFISYAFHQAGAGDDFPYSAGHCTFINHSIRNASQGSNGKLMAHKLNRYAIKPGDLLGYWRGERKITINNAVRIGWYQSHTEIVTEVHNGYAFTIGGNVMNTVTRRQLKLNSSGHLIDRRENWFVAIENRM